MPLAAERSRRVAVAIPEVRISNVVAVSPRQQRAESLQQDVAHHEAIVPMPTSAAGGGFNFVLTNTALTDAGNNTGGGINITTDPTAANPGNCSKSLCINLFGIQLL